MELIVISIFTTGRNHIGDSLVLGSTSYESVTDQTSYKFLQPKKDSIQ